MGEEEDENSPIDYFQSFDFLDEPDKSLSEYKNLITLSVQGSFNFLCNKYLDYLTEEINKFQNPKGDEEKYSTMKEWVIKNKEEFIGKFRTFEILKENLKNIANFLEAKKSLELNHFYIKALKSHLYFAAYASNFFCANVLFCVMGVSFEMCNVRGVQTIESVIQDIYSILLGNYLNSIGSGLFLSGATNFKFSDILYTIKELKIKTKDGILVQKSATRNGMLEFMPRDDLKDILKSDFSLDKFKCFNFKEFESIFGKMTGEKNVKGVFDALAKVAENTEKTPLNFFYMIIDDARNRIYFDEADNETDNDLSDNIFLSSPPHPYEKLIMRKLAHYETIPCTDKGKGEDKNHKKNHDEAVEEEEEEEDNAVEVENYIQLYCADFRGKSPVYSRSKSDNDELSYKDFGIKLSIPLLPPDFTIRGTCYIPFYYNLEKISEEDKKDEEALSDSRYLEVVDCLQPLDYHLLHLFETCAILKMINTNGDGVHECFCLKDQSPKSFLQRQIDCIEILIAYILYPDTKFQVSKKATRLFILSVFGQLNKFLLAAKSESGNDDDFQSAGEIRFKFAIAMEGIIPAVYHNLTNLAIASQEKVTNDSLFKQSAEEIGHFFNAFSFKTMITKFLTNPDSRRMCPVIYNYLRLIPRFGKINLIPNIAKFLTKLWEKRKIVKDDQDITFSAIDDINQNEINEFFKDWIAAAEFVRNGLMTNESREYLERTIPSDYLDFGNLKLRDFLPFEPQKWPGLIVLEALSEGHNEFISCLQSHSKIHVDEVKDYELMKQSSHMIDPTICNGILIDCIRDKIDDEGYPIFDKEAENNFVLRLARNSYSYIIHPLFNCGGTVSTSTETQSLIGHFEEQFPTHDISEDQKKDLFMHIKSQNKSPGLMLLFDQYMFAILDIIKQSANKIMSNCSLEQFHTDHFKDVQLSQIETEGLEAFRIANNKSNKFTVGNIASIYNYLSEPVDSAQQSKTVQDIVMKNFREKIEILENEIPSQPPVQITVYRPYYTLIPKIAADLLNANLVKSDMRNTCPSKILQMWQDLNKGKEICGKMLLDPSEIDVIDQIIKADDPKNGAATFIAYYNDARNKISW